VTRLDAGGRVVLLCPAGRWDHPVAGMLLDTCLDPGRSIRISLSAMVFDRDRSLL